MAESIGFIGLGSMGAPMARNLMSTAPRLIVRDRTGRAVAPMVALGAVTVGSAKAVADQAEIIFICVPNNDTVRQVLLDEDGVINGEAVKLVVNLGTTGSAFSREMSAALGAKSVQMLDSPISGGPDGAAKATLAIMASGPRAAFARVEAMLNVMGRNVTFVSEQDGAAQTLKLANNLLSAAAFAVTTEAMIMGAKAGLDPAMMLEVINAGSGRNTATADKFPKTVLPRTFNQGAAFNTICKDVKLCVAEAEELGVPMWVGTAVRHLFLCGSAHFGGTEDLTRLVEYVEELAKVQIPLVPAQRPTQKPA